MVQAEFVDLSRNGITGSLTLGGSSSKFESNYYLGVKDDVKVKSLTGKAKSETGFAPIIAFEVAYTISSVGQQYFFNNLVNDELRGDINQQLGFRQETDIGIVSTSLLFNLMPNEGYANPYGLNVKRKKTDITSSGVRLALDNVGNIGLNTAFTYRKVDVDKERSGSGLSAGDMKLLNREGKVLNFHASWDLPLSNEQFLTPLFEYEQGDKDGKAESYKSQKLGIDYVLLAGDTTFTLGGYYKSKKADKINPIFDKKDDAKEYSVNVSLSQDGLMGYDFLSGFVMAGYARSDSDIDYKDIKNMNVGGGVVFSF